MTRRLRIAAIAVLCAATTLLLCEFCVRYLQDVIPARAGTPYVTDPDCGYTLRPSLPEEFEERDDRHVNTLGFRDREHPLAKPAGVRRIVGLGDSFVYGDVPIAHNFLRLLEAELRDASTNAEVIIAGLPGWDVRNAVGLMRGKGPDLRPDLAVLCFSVGSDVTGIPIPGAVYQGNLHFVGSQQPLLNLLRKSRLFVLAEQLYLVRITNAVRRLQAKARFGGDQAVAAPSTKAATDEPPLPPGAPYFAGMWGEADDPQTRTPCSPDFLRHQVRNLRLFRESPDAEVESWWAQAEQQLLDFDAACRAAGADWLLLIAPAEVQVDPRTRAEILTHAPLPPDSYDFAAPSRRLAAFADAHGIAWLDPLAELRATHAEGGTRLYIPNNGHWSVPGNGLMAEMVANRISGENLTQ